MRILVDMNLTPRWVSYLVDAGHDAIHWSSVGSKRAEDGEICDHARKHGYVLLTNDLDFPRILALTKEAAPSVILMRGEPLVPEVRGLALLSAIAVCEAAIIGGAIVTLDSEDRSRARVLPLQ
jgi:predicted nuclease of predicted toxin-antitoxin system